MRLTTACPECHTLFNVVADQLKISEGWVRCGQCGHVFNALLHFAKQDPAVIHSKPVISTAAKEAIAPVPVLPTEHALPATSTPAAIDKETLSDSQSFDFDLEAWRTARESLRSARAQAAALDAKGPASAKKVAGVPGARVFTPLAPFSDPGPALASTSAQTPASAIAATPIARAGPASFPALSPTPDIETWVAADDWTSGISNAGPVSAEAQPKVNQPLAKQQDQQPPEPDVSFVQEARRKAFWQKTSIRLALTSLCLLLMAALTLQAAVHHRDTLAAQEPRLLPFLLEVCLYAHCQIKPPRDIASVIVDSASLTKTDAAGQSFRLAFVIKNKSSLALEAPLLELTLLDAQDKAFVRRILGPAEYGATAPVLQVQTDFAGQVDFDLSGSSLNAPALNPPAGYLVVAFYP